MAAPVWSVTLWSVSSVTNQRQPLAVAFIFIILTDPDFKTLCARLFSLWYLKWLDHFVCPTSLLGLLIQGADQNCYGHVSQSKGWQCAMGGKGRFYWGGKEAIVLRRNRGDCVGRKEAIVLSGQGDCVDWNLESVELISDLHAYKFDLSHLFIDPGRLYAVLVQHALPVGLVDLVGDDDVQAGELDGETGGTGLVIVLVLGARAIRTHGVLHVGDVDEHAGRRGVSLGEGCTLGQWVPHRRPGHRRRRWRRTSAGRCSPAFGSRYRPDPVRRSSTSARWPWLWSRRWPSRPLEWTLEGRWKRRLDVGTMIIIRVNDMYRWAGIAAAEPCLWIDQLSHAASIRTDSI